MDKTIALYMRLSDEDDNLAAHEESNSISHQRKLMLDHIQKLPELKGCNILEFADDGYSGADFNRPNFVKMMDLVKAGKIQIIVTKDYSRLGRDYLEVGGGNPKKVQEAIKRFKNESYPSIAVTVDLLTTGIDVPEITTLVFMRRVKSRILFEQMLGRATRLCPKIHKTHFEIYDPVGVYDSLNDVNTMKPVVVNPTTSFTQLLDGLSEINDDKQVEQQINQIIAKLQRKKRNMSPKMMDYFISMTDGKDPSQLIMEIEKSDVQEAKNRLLKYRDVFKMLQETKANGSRPVVVSDAEDVLTEHSRGYGNAEKPEDYLNAFSRYIQSNRNEIAALNIICTRPKDLTRKDLKDLRLTLDREGFTTQQLNTALYELTNEEIMADIISLIRRYAIGSTLPL